MWRHLCSLAARVLGAEPKSGHEGKTSYCEDGPAAGPKLQARPSVGTGRPGRTGRPSKRARNGAKARTCLAMRHHSVVERSRFASSVKIFVETARGGRLCKLMEKRKGWGASPAIRSMGQGDKAARICNSTAVLVPLQRIFGFGRLPSPPGGSNIRRGRKRVWHAHVHHHWLPREVQEEVTVLGIALEARREPFCTGGAAGVGGGSRTGGCGGVWGGLGRWGEAIARPSLCHWSSHAFIYIYICMIMQLETARDTRPGGM